MPSACRVGGEPASPQAAPSARFPAGGPGQPSTAHRFSRRTGSSLPRSAFQGDEFRCDEQLALYPNRFTVLVDAVIPCPPLWRSGVDGPAENCRRVSVRPGEAAGRRLQGVRSRDAASPPTRQPEGISGGHREAAIFRPGAGIVKGVAENALNTFAGDGRPERHRTWGERNLSAGLHGEISCDLKKVSVTPAGKLPPSSPASYTYLYAQTTQPETPVTTLVKTRLLISLIHVNS